MENEYQILGVQCKPRNLKSFPALIDSILSYFLQVYIINHGCISKFCKILSMKTKYCNLIVYIPPPKKICVYWNTTKLT